MDVDAELFKGDDGKWRRLKSKFFAGCIYGACPECTVVKDGRGFHEVEVYEIIQMTDLCKCEECGGTGTVREECPYCEGFGTVHKDCECCHGSGELYDYSSEERVVGTQSVLVHRKKTK